MCIRDSCYCDLEEYILTRALHNHCYCDLGEYILTRAREISSRRLQYDWPGISFKSNSQAHREAVSYTHLDVYKRQVYSSFNGLYVILLNGSAVSTLFCLPVVFHVFIRLVLHSGIQFASFTKHMFLFDGLSSYYVNYLLSLTILDYQTSFVFIFHQSFFMIITDRPLCIIVFKSSTSHRKTLYSNSAGNKRKA